MKKCCFLFAAIILFCHHSFAQAKTDDLLVKIFGSSKSNILSTVSQNPAKYRCQIIYTQINRNKHNVPKFTNYYFNYDPQQYYYPASVVKLPLALLSLEKLNLMNKKDVNKNTPIQFDSSYRGQVVEYKDSTSTNGLPSIAHFIKKAFLISDNDAYNRMYQFVGQQTINRQLHKKGYKNARIVRQFMPFDEDQNRHTNQARFIKEDGSLLYTQPAAYNTDSFDFKQPVFIGNAYYNRNDSLVNEPFDFTRHNTVPLQDFQQILQSVLFPKSVHKKQRFKLTEDDYMFVYQYLSQYPSETNYPKYDSSEFYDSVVKLFFKDSTHSMPTNVRVFNKVGWAYGFLTDVSYVADFTNNVEFMLAATIYVNSDGIINDNKYDYDSVGYPYLYELGQAIYGYELQRKRAHTPNLGKFKLQYEHRNPGDKRKSVKEVEN
jgi:hypothetical protein